MKYRKRPGRIHQWHNQPWCPEWPTDEFLEHKGNPKVNDICPHCTAIAELEEKTTEIRKATDKKSTNDLASTKSDRLRPK
jgi:phage FluMu protein Com